MIIKRVHGSVGEMKKKKETKRNLDVQEGEQETKRRITEVYTIVHSNLIRNCVINIHTHVHKI